MGHALDVCGRQLNVGDYILYAAMCGQSVELTFARIITLKDKKNIDGEVISTAVGARAVYGGLDYNRIWKKWGLLSPKIITLHRSTVNVTKMNDSDLPAEVLDLLAPLVPSS